MRKAADLLRERFDHVSKVMTQEQGKVYVESRAEVITSADIIDWYAEEGRRTYGRVVPGRQKGVRQMVIQEPVGVVAAFTPWNFPTLTPVRKIAGALAAGCSIIIKASEETPGGCVELVKCFADAGLPAGVLNLVFGVPAEVSEHLIPKKSVKKISFTGSVPVGKHLAELAAKGMGKNLDDPSFEPLWATAEDLGAFVFIHPNNVAGADRMVCVPEQGSKLRPGTNGVG